MRDSQHASSLTKPAAKVKPGADIEPLLDIASVARILSIHKISAYRLCYKRKLAYLKLDGCGLRVRPNDLRSYIEQGENGRRT